MSSEPISLRTLGTPPSNMRVSATALLVVICASATLALPSVDKQGGVHCLPPRTPGADCPPNSNLVQKRDSYECCDTTAE